MVSHVVVKFFMPVAVLLPSTLTGDVSGTPWPIDTSPELLVFLENSGNDFTLTYHVPTFFRSPRNFEGLM